MTNFLSENKLYNTALEFVCLENCHFHLEVEFIHTFTHTFKTEFIHQENCILLPEQFEVSTLIIALSWLEHWNVYLINTYFYPGKFKFAAYKLFLFGQITFLSGIIPGKLHFLTGQPEVSIWKMKCLYLEKLISLTVK